MESQDFNGIQIWNLLRTIGKEWNEIKPHILDLIKSDSIRIIDDEKDINPNIIRVGFDPLEVQLKKANADTPGYMCLYPTKSILKKFVDPSDYNSEPYKLRLALGEAQLSYVSFDLSVLEFYRNDPRYRYENDDIQGHIYYNDEQLPESDRAFLKTYGFAYDEDFNRAVAVFLRYLTGLTPEHQQIWKAKELKVNYKLHPGYYRNLITCSWDCKVSICKALLMELYIINIMANAMGRPPLFNEDYGQYGEKRPKRFGFLIRPTLEEFNNFIHLFDKMLSDNINKEFFQNDISYEIEMKRKDGKIQVQQKGTLKILDDWIRIFYNTHDLRPWEKSIETLRKIRKMRQTPAHKVNEDQFDQNYFKEQRMIIIDAYLAVRTLRLMFATHPKVKSTKIEIPDWLEKHQIWTM